MADLDWRKDEDYEYTADLALEPLLGHDLRFDSCKYAWRVSRLTQDQLRTGELRRRSGGIHHHQRGGLISSMIASSVLESSFR